MHYISMHFISKYKYHRLDKAGGLDAFQTIVFQ